MTVHPRLTADLLKRTGAPAVGSTVVPERAVQFGTGAFLRGFVDDFLHRANERGLWNGRVVAVGSTGSNRDQALTEQDGLYTLVVRGIEDGTVVEERRVIRSLSHAISAVDDWAGVLKLARSPELEVVFSNTTEAGIRLNEGDAFHDAPPSSFPAKLTRFLYERGQAFDFSGHGLTVVPCELIEDNGRTLREMVLALAARWEVDATCVRWMEREVRFVNTLVDRIVPGAPKGDDARTLAEELGYDDALLTTSEPYRLFALEGDEALRAALPWTAVDTGIVITDDISPYRARKLYILNGAHTSFVSMALLLGHETVVGAMGDPVVRDFVRQVVFDEIVPTLDVEGAKEFANAVIDRFSNPFIQHALMDITLQATMKMRVRVVPTIERYVARMGTAPDALAFSMATFLLLKRQPAQRTDDQGETIVRAWAEHGEDHASLVEAVLGNESLWGTDMAALPGFSEAVIAHLEAIRSHGVRDAVCTTRHIN